MGKTIINEIVERFKVDDKSAGVFGRIARRMDVMQKKSFGARLAVMGLQKGLGLLKTALKASLVVVTALTAAFVALSVVLLRRGLGSMVKQEAAALAVTGALGQQGTLTRELRDEVMALAAAQQYQLNVADDVIAEADAYLISIGVQVEQLEELNTAIRAVAVVGKMDFAGAARLVGKTIDSGTNSLTRYGVEIDMAGDKEARINELIQNTAKFLPLVAAEVNSLGGLWETLGLALDDGTEQIWDNDQALAALRLTAHSLIPVIGNLGKTLTSAWGDGSEGAKKFAQTMQDVSLMTIDVLQAMSKVLIWVLQKGLQYYEFYNMAKGAAAAPFKGSLLGLAIGTDTKQEIDDRQDMIFRFRQDIDNLGEGLDDLASQATSAITSWDVEHLGKYGGAFDKLAGDLTGGTEEIAGATAAGAESWINYANALKIAQAASDSMQRAAHGPALGAGAESGSGGVFAQGLYLQSVGYQDLIDKLGEYEQRHTALTETINYQLETQRAGIEAVGQVASSVGQQFTGAFADMIVDGTWDAEQAVKGLAKTIITTLIGSYIQLAIQWQVQNALKATEIAMLQVEVKTVQKLIMLHIMLAGVKMASGGAGAMGGGAGAGAGGIGQIIGLGKGIGLFHEGGPVPKAHSGLSVGDVGPYILQRGEYVMRREAVQSIGQDNVQAMNETGMIQRNGDTYQVTIHAGAGADGRMVAQEFVREMNWQSRTGELQIHSRGLQRD